MSTNNARPTYQVPVPKGMEKEAFGIANATNFTGLSANFIGDMVEWGVNSNIANRKLDLATDIAGKQQQLGILTLLSREVLAQKSADVAMFVAKCQKEVEFDRNRTSTQLEYLRQKGQTERATVISLRTAFMPTTKRSSYFYG